MGVTDQEIKTMLDGDTDECTVADINIMLRLAKEYNFDSAAMVNRCKPAITEFAQETFTEEFKNYRVTLSFTQFEKDLTIQGILIPCIEHVVKKSFDLAIELDKAKEKPADIATALNRKTNEFVKSVEKASEIIEKQSRVLAMRIHSTKYPDNSTQYHNEHLQGCIQYLQEVVKTAINKYDQLIVKPQPLLTAFNAKKITTAPTSQPVAQVPKLNTVG